MARSGFLIFIAALIFSTISCYAVDAPIHPVGLNIAKIQKLTGQTGQLDQDERIYKITIPRDDLKILMSGIQVTPDRGLASWVAFKKTDTTTFVNGDLILLEDQINPVMSVVLTNGLQVTGLHNPYLWDSPRVMFMHIKGEGDEFQLASAIGQVLKKIKDTSNGSGDFPLGNFDFLKTTLDSHKIDVILGQKGQFKEDVYKVEFSDGIKATDSVANKTMAVNTWAAFAGSDNEAVVNGTLVVHKAELQKALVKLRNAQIYVLAIYQHMIDDDQDLVLINFWGIGNVQTLAKTLRSVFVIAQNNNPTNLTVGGILADTADTHEETEAGVMPIQLSLLQKDNCGYAKAKELYSSADSMENVDVYAQQLNATLRTALHLTQKIVSGKLIQFVSFLPVQSAANTQVAPSAKSLLLKLSVVTHHVAPFAQSFAVTSVATAPVSAEQSIAAVPSTQMALLAVMLSHASAEFYASVTQLIASYVSQFQSLDHTVVASVKARINALSALVSNTVTRVQVNTDTFIVAYMNSSQALAQATLTRVKARVNGSFSFLSDGVTHAEGHVIALAASGVTASHVLADATVASIQSGINALSDFVHTSQMFAHVAMAHVKADVSTSFAFLSGAAIDMHAHVNALAAASIHQSQSVASAAAVILLSKASSSQAYAKNVVLSLRQSWYFLKNNVRQWAQFSVNKSSVLLAKMKKPALKPAIVQFIAQSNPITLTPLPAAKLLPSQITTATPSVIAVNKMTRPLKSLANKSVVTSLPIAKNTVHSSLPIPRQARLINHPLVAKVKPVVKPPVSLAQTQLVSAGKRLNKALSVSLHTAHDKSVVLTRVAVRHHPVYPVAHTMHYQPVEKSEVIAARAVPHIKNWNTEQLAPAVRPPVRVAQKNVYHEAEEFDNGPAPVGVYPYDEEPTPGGFGG